MMSHVPFGTYQVAKIGTKKMVDPYLLYAPINVRASPMGQA